MLMPLFAAMYFNDTDWHNFFICILITAFFGGSLTLTFSGAPVTINRRQGFLLIIMSWLSVAAFAALPFHLGHLKLDITDSIFEAVSAITTTGSTVISGLDNAPPGILLWRALLQWLGGIGIVITAMSLLPFLKIGGMQIFQTELSESEKALPRTTVLAISITAIYIAITAAGTFSYHIAGMTLFDAIIHSMTTLSTGGFSSHDASFESFNEPAIHYTAIIFMIIGSMPFILYLKAATGNIRPFLSDPQVKLFMTIIIIGTFLMTFYLMKTIHSEWHNSFRISLFSIVSLITGTGYTIGDFNSWGGFAISLVFFLMFMGACAGSTTCGIKIFRFQILFELTKVQIKQLLHPSGIFIPHYNKRPIPKGVPASVISFLFIYIMIFALLATLLSMTGIDFITAISGAATAISNVGPGFGDTIGPNGNFSSLPDSAKWLLSAGMMLGRLELFPILVLLSPQFWIR